MSLFNLISIRNLFVNNLKIVNSIQSFGTIPNDNVDWKQSKNNHIMVSNQDRLLIKVDHSSSLIIENSNNNFTNKKLISPSFFTGFINKYWQETIFISKSNIVTEKYTNQLKSDGVSVHHHQYKKFLFDFSKALIKGRINTYLNEPNNINIVNDDSTDIRYTWRKGLNLSLPIRKSFLSLNQYKSRYLNKQQVNFIKKLKNYNLPIFTVTNNLNQIIVAEPPDELMYNNHLLDNIYQWYYNNILSQTDRRPAYEGLFFVNSKDALEYKEYIKQKYINYNIYDSQNKLNIFSSSLDLYYQLIHTSHPRVKFYLIPDLKELGELIYKYQYYKNITFHNKQKYGKDYFQGQPIYIIQPTYCKNSKTNDFVKYFYAPKQKKSNKQYETVFMNYRVALLAWQKFLDNHKDYHLPSKPRILVYNLEDFLTMHENDINLHKTNILFVPNKESYTFIKLIQQQRNSNTVFQGFSSQLLYFKIIAKRLIWSLTSRQPINL